MTWVLLNTLLVAQGGLLSEVAPRAGLLLEAQVSPSTTPTLDDLTLQQLEAERARVISQRPSPLPGALVLAGGGGVLTVGLGIFLFSSLVVGGIVMAIATPLMVTGVVLLLMSAPARHEADDRLKAIDRATRALRILEQQRDEVPPPPPPLPPGV
jgi:hypothetical protein